MADKNHYILDKSGNVSAVDLMTWAKWMETTNRQIALDKLPNGVTVSTVFLGLNHNWGSGDPVLWETMIFGGIHDEYQERYSSKESALAGHQKAIALAKDN